MRKITLVLALMLVSMAVHADPPRKSVPLKMAAAPARAIHVTLAPVFHNATDADAAAPYAYLVTANGRESVEIFIPLDGSPAAVLHRGEVQPPTAADLATVKAAFAAMIKYAVSIGVQ